MKFCRKLKRLVQLIFTFSLLLLVGNGYSQEMFGLSTSNYAGSNSLVLNPANLINSKNYIDINIFSLDFFLDNNSVYISRQEYSLKTIITKEGQIVDPKYYSPSKYTIYDRYSNKSDKRVFQQARILGPSFMMNNGPHAFAITTAFRNVVSLENVPYHIAKFGYEGFDFKPQQMVRYDGRNFDIYQMTWGEVNFSYANRLIDNPEYTLSWGITAKKLYGFSGMYLKANDLDYMVESDSVLWIYNMNADLGVSLPMKYDTNLFDTQHLIHGSSWGFDIGIVFKKNSRYYTRLKDHTAAPCAQKFEEYDYKLGVSLMDIGSINFTTNARMYEYRDVSTYWPHVDNLKWNSVNAAISDINTHFYNNPKEIPDRSGFKLFLPTTLSVQFDYHFQDGFYMNSVFMYPVKLSKPTIWRPSQLAIIPRYESRRYDFFIPLELYNLQKPRIGLAARFYFFTIGTDKLGSLLGYSDFSGTDLYFGFKINLNKGYCNKKPRGNSCPNFEWRR